MTKSWEVLSEDEALKLMDVYEKILKPWRFIGIGEGTYLRAMRRKTVSVETAGLLRFWLKKQEEA
jgi:hypothetical protein